MQKRERANSGGEKKVAIKKIFFYEVILKRCNFVSLGLHTRYDFLSNTENCRIDATCGTAHMHID